MIKAIQQCGVVCNYSYVTIRYIRNRKEIAEYEHGNTQSEHTKNTDQNKSEETNEELKGIIGSLVEEMKRLHETVHRDITELHGTVSKQKEDISKLKEPLADSDSDLRKHLIKQTEQNTQKIELVLEEISY